MNVFEKLVLPNGTQIPNRIAKAAMEEKLLRSDREEIGWRDLVFGFL